MYIFIYRDPEREKESERYYRLPLFTSMSLSLGILSNSSQESHALLVTACYFSSNRFKHNVTIREINQAVVKSILEAVFEDKSRPKQVMLQDLEKVSKSMHI